MNAELRAVEWSDNGLLLIDQTVLPERVEYLAVRTVDQLVDAIRRLVVRGAPAIGAAGAYGVALAALQGEQEGWSGARVREAVTEIREARPTAVNLAVGVDRVLPFLDRGIAAALAEAQAVQREDVEGNRAMGRFGADWLLDRVRAARGARGEGGGAGEGNDRPLRILTHCNTGALATAGWGTALGIIRELHVRGLVEMVYADETRPLLQGSRLTAFELDYEGIPHRVQVDGAAAGTILRGEVDAAIVGADRIAGNGDTANKVGTVGVALACADAGIPFLVAAPTTTVDVRTATGAEIEIEMRDGAEVVEFGGRRTAPKGSQVHNPAFDVTPGRLISALVTERGVLEVSAGEVPAGRLG